MVAAPGQRMPKYLLRVGIGYLGWALRMWHKKARGKVGQGVLGKLSRGSRSNKQATLEQSTAAGVTLVG